MTFMAKYRGIFEKLQSEIRGAPRGMKHLASEPVLEKRFGVSRITIRRAVDLLARAGLVQKIQGHGTDILPQPLRGVPGELWVVLSRHINGAWTDKFYAPMVAALAEGAKGQGLSVRRFRDSDRGPMSDSWRDNRKGPPLVVFVGPCLPSLANFAMGRGATVVHLDGGDKSPGHLWVREDVLAGARLAARAIERWGYKRLAILYAPGNATWDRRLACLSGELLGAAQGPVACQSICLSSVGSDEYGRAQRAMHKYLAGGHGGFDLLVGVSDALARGALAALREKNISCPGQVAILGWDGLVTAPGETRITTVAVGPEKMGREALRVALRLDPGSWRLPVHLKVPPDLRAGDTTPA